MDAILVIIFGRYYEKGDFDLRCMHGGAVCDSGTIRESGYIKQAGWRKKGAPCHEKREEGQFVRVLPYDRWNTKAETGVP